MRARICIALQFGEPVALVEIDHLGGGSMSSLAKRADYVPDPGREERVREQLLHDIEHDRGPLTDGTLKRLCVTLAGMVASRRVAPDIDWRWKGRADRRQALAMARSVTPSKDAARQLLDHCLGEAEGLVAQSWAAIERVALALVERGRLDGHEVRAIAGSLRPPRWRRRRRW